jgi:BirA family biotin operon repressor/biotin-[acetyl-CoA-carboxylase] ligase
MSPSKEQHLHWNVEALWQQLEPLLPGLSIEVLARIESTNTALLDRVRSGGANGATRGGGEERRGYGRRAQDLQPCLLVAEAQTHGRGRMGRSWQSNAGDSLTFSLALPMAATDWSGLSLIVGTAIADALDPPGDAAQGWAPRLQLKWPNDIWLDGRKLGGILIETVAAGQQRIAIVGVGLNVRASAELATASFATGYASLDELIPGVSAPEALARCTPALVRALREFPQTSFSPAWLAAYSRRDLLRGRAISAGALDGVGQGVNAHGELLLQDAQGQQHAIGSGEVSVRLAASSAGTGS